MFMTEGHRIPSDLPAFALLTPDVAERPLDECECPLDGARHDGPCRASGILRLVPPVY